MSLATLDPGRHAPHQPTSIIPEKQVFLAAILYYAVQKSIYTAQQRLYVELLRQVRQEADLTQVELAAKLGTIQSRITDYERGIRRMDLMELRQFCEAVGVTLVDFVERFERLVTEQSKRLLE